MTRLRLAVAAALCALGLAATPRVPAQSPPATINITANSCLAADASGTLIPRGTLTTTAVDATGAPLAFTANGTQLTMAASTAPVNIVAGSIVGTLHLANPALTSPLNIGYTFTIRNSVTLQSTTLKAVAIAPDSSGNFNLCAVSAGTYQSAVPVTYPTGDTVINGGGASGTVAIGTTTTLSPGASATVTNVGTSTAAVLNFGIPMGATGATGPTGPTGPAGTAGTTTLTAGSGITITGSPTSGYTVSVAVPVAPVSFGGLGPDGATSTVTTSGTTAILSNGTVLAGLSNSGSDVGNTYGPFAFSGNRVYLILQGCSHTFQDPATSQTFAFNPGVSITYTDRNGNPVTGACLYENSNDLFTTFSVKVTS